MTIPADPQFDYLDDEERDLVESIENGEWQPVEDVEKARSHAHRYAVATLKNLDESLALITLQDGGLDWKRYSESIKNATLYTDYQIKSA